MSDILERRHVRLPAEGYWYRRKFWLDADKALIFANALDADGYTRLAQEIRELVKPVAWHLSGVLVRLLHPSASGEIQGGSE